MALAIEVVGERLASGKLKVWSMASQPAAFFLHFLSATNTCALRARRLTAGWSAALCAVLQGVVGVPACGAAAHEAAFHGLPLVTSVATGVAPPKVRNPGRAGQRC